MKRLTLALGLLLSPAAHADVAQDILGRWTTGFMTEPQGVWQYRMSYNFTQAAISVDFDILVNHPLGQASWREQYSGPYKIGAASPDVPGAVNIDVTLSNRLLTPLHPGTVTEWNAKKECGLDGWVAGVPRDVSGKTCEASQDSTDLSGTMYEIIKVIPNESIQLGLTPDNGPIGTDPGHRPTSLDPDQLIPRNGHGGTANPDPVDQLLPGNYAVTSYKKNATGCDLSVATAGAPFPYFEIYANASLVPYMPGWSNETCTSLQQCKDQPRSVQLGSEFPIDETIASGGYQGKIVQTTWVGTCHATVTVAATLRDKTSGALTMTARTLAGDVSGVTDIDHCSSEDPRIDQQLEHFTCQYASAMTATPAGP